MRLSASFGALAITAFAVGARADDSAPPTTPPPEETDAVRGLRTELARQAEELRALRADLDDEKRARERAVVRVSGFVQVDWILHNQSSQNEINDSNGTLLNQDRFTLRRGHLRVDGDLGLVSAALEIDANTTNGPQVRPIDAEVSVRTPAPADDPRFAGLPSLTATAGLLRIPFGHEVQELDWVRPFLERATVLQALFPGEFDLGVRLKAKYRFLDLAVALMNGSPIGTKVFPDLDPTHEKDVVGRLGIDVELASGVRLQAGASADTGTGFHAGTPTTKSQLVWQDANGDGVVQPTEIVAIPGSAATPSQTFHRFAFGGDARLGVRLPFLGELAFRAEVVSGVNLDRGLEVADPSTAGRDLREVGWYVGATQELTRWGMIGVRYDRYNPDADANSQRGVQLVPVDRSYGTLAIMGMLRYGNQRLLLEYDVSSNPLGLSPDGSPTTLADNAVTLRAQAVF
jgi:hypothetical protein